MITLHASWHLLGSYGYQVDIINDSGDVAESYSAGNNPKVSDLSAAVKRGGVGKRQLRKWAKQTSGEMLAAHGQPDGRIVCDRDGEREASHAYNG